MTNFRLTDTFRYVIKEINEQENRATIYIYRLIDGKWKFVFSKEIPLFGLLTKFDDIIQECKQIHIHNKSSRR